MANTNNDIVQQYCNHIFRSLSIFNDIDGQLDLYIFFFIKSHFAKWQRRIDIYVSINMHWIIMMTSPMEIISALLVLCVGNSPVFGKFPSQRPVTRSFDISFDLRFDVFVDHICIEALFN